MACSALALTVSLEEVLSSAFTELVIFSWRVCSLSLSRWASRSRRCCSLGHCRGGRELGGGGEGRGGGRRGGGGGKKRREGGKKRREGGRRGGGMRGCASGQREGCG